MISKRSNYAAVDSDESDEQEDDDEESESESEAECEYWILKFSTSAQTFL